jgi:hypothetical protein
MKCPEIWRAAGTAFENEVLAFCESDKRGYSKEKMLALAAQVRSQERRAEFILCFAFRSLRFGSQDVVSDAKSLRSDRQSRVYRGRGWEK